jgi:hypothetical protein
MPAAATATCTCSTVACSRKHLNVLCTWRSAQASWSCRGLGRCSAIRRDAGRKSCTRSTQAAGDAAALPAAVQAAEREPAAGASDGRRPGPGQRELELMEIMEYGDDGLGQGPVDWTWTRPGRCSRQDEGREGDVFSARPPRSISLINMKSVVVGRQDGQQTVKSSVASEQARASGETTRLQVVQREPWARARAPSGWWRA